MEGTTHLGLFLGALAVIWFFAGWLVEAVERVARFFHRSGFAVAFVLLGVLTSLTEISVVFNATWQGVPQVSAGNLGSASLVIFFLVIPLLAIFGGGIRLRNSITKRHLALALAVIGLPPLVAALGTLTRWHGMVLIVAYGVLLLAVAGRRGETISPRSERRLSISGALLRLLVAAILIFGAARLLVREAVVLSEIWRVPSSLVGLLILSVGTNLPELTIALRAVLKNRKAIALGDYLGSAAMNTFLFGLLIIMNGSFVVEQREFALTALVMLFGLGIFWVSARSKYTISRGEGVLLGAVYLVFFVTQLVALL